MARSLLLDFLDSYSFPASAFQLAKFYHGNATAEAVSKLSTDYSQHHGREHEASLMASKPLEETIYYHKTHRVWHSLAPLLKKLNQRSLKCLSQI